MVDKFLRKFQISRSPEDNSGKVLAIRAGGYVYYSITSECLHHSLCDNISHGCDTYVFVFSSAPQSCLAKRGRE
jgi:hypothetical protein